MASSTPLLNEYPHLSKLSETDLKDILTDDRLCQAVLSTLPQVKQTLDEQENLSLQNEAQAKTNLALQEQLLALRTATASAYAKAVHMKDRWVEIESQQAALYQKFRPSFLHMRLRHSVDNLETQTEAMAASFIEGTDDDQSVDAFIKSLKAERKEFHKQAYWCEKWSKGEVAWRED